MRFGTLKTAESALKACLVAASCGCHFRLGSCLDGSVRWFDRWTTLGCNGLWGSPRSSWFSHSPDGLAVQWLELVTLLFFLEAKMVR